MKTRFLIALAVFVPLFYQPQNAAAVVGHAAQLVDNQQVSAKKMEFSPKPERSKYPADRMANWGFWIGFSSWMSLLVPYFWIFAPLSFFGFFVAFGLGLAALRRKTVLRQKAMLAAILGAVFPFLLVTISFLLILVD